MSSKFFPDDKRGWRAANILDVNQKKGVLGLITVLKLQYLDDRSESKLDDKIFREWKKIPELQSTLDQFKSLGAYMTDEDACPVATKNDYNDGYKLHDTLDAEYLSEALLFHIMLKRYTSGSIYSRVGDVLVAMNPFRDYAFNLSYGPTVIHRYAKTTTGLPPHIYELAKAALNDVRLNKSNQAILTTGESGSGKTETSKLLLAYFAEVTCQLKSVTQTRISTIDTKISDVNYMLESFGNAVTMRNHNSSRFGKWIELQYDPSCILQSAQLMTFVLETSRCISQGPGERNFHCFYRLLSTSAAESNLRLRECQEQVFNVLERLNLSVSDLRVLYPRRVSGTDITKGWSEDFLRREDAKETERLIGALEGFDLDADKSDEMYLFVLSLPMLGEIDFAEKNDGSGKGQITDRGEKILKQFCSLNRLEYSHILAFLTEKKFKNDVFPLLVLESQRNLTALITQFYDRFFKYLITQVNSALYTCRNGAGINTSIGILDIAGFEHFKVNGLEQLMINFVNERLQNLFNQDFYLKEKMIYDEEDLGHVLPPLQNNDEIFEMIGGATNRRSILNMLVEALITPGNKKDQAFVREVEAKYLESKYLSKAQGSDFVITHFAGDVPYTTSTNGGWTSNIDMRTSQNVVDGVKNGSNAMFKKMFKDIVIEGQGKLQGATLVSKFLSETNELIDTIQSCRTHYIRCIKPNDVMSYKAPINYLSTLYQMKCSGVVEGIKIRRYGFAFRVEHKTIFNKYIRILGIEEGDRKRKAGPSVNIITKIITTAYTILKNNNVHGYELLSMDSVKIGRGRVFAKNDLTPLLDTALDTIWLERMRSIANTRIAKKFVFRLRHLTELHILRDLRPYIEAAEKAQKQVPTVPGGLYLYPHSVFKGVTTGRALIEVCCRVGSILERLKCISMTKHGQERCILMSKALDRMVIEARINIELERWLHKVRKHPKLSAEELSRRFNTYEIESMEKLLVEAKKNHIYTNKIEEVWNMCRMALKMLSRQAKRTSRSVQSSARFR